MAKKEKSDKEKMKSDAKGYVEAYAEDQEIGEDEARARLICLAWNRLKALKRDNTRRAKGLKPKFRKVVVTALSSKASKPAKKAKSKKAKKASAKPAHTNSAASQVAAQA